MGPYGLDRPGPYFFFFGFLVSFFGLLSLATEILPYVEIIPAWGTPISASCFSCLAKKTKSRPSMGKNRLFPELRNGAARQARRHRLRATTAANPATKSMIEPGSGADAVTDTSSMPSNEGTCKPSNASSVLLVDALTV